MGFDNRTCMWRGQPVTQAEYDRLSREWADYWAKAAEVPVARASDIIAAAREALEEVGYDKRSIAGDIAAKKRASEQERLRVVKNMQARLQREEEAAIMAMPAPADVPVGSWWRERRNGRDATYRVEAYLPDGTVEVTRWFDNFTTRLIFMNGTARFRDGSMVRMFPSETLTELDATIERTKEAQARLETERRALRSRKERPTPPLPVAGMTADEWAAWGMEQQNRRGAFGNYDPPIESGTSLSMLMERGEKKQERPAERDVPMAPTPGRRRFREEE